MKMKDLILIGVIVFGLVACSDDNETQAYYEKCAADTTGCAALYRGAVNVAGTAAVSGLPQVAAVGSTPQQGQVPDTSILPASVKVTDAQLQSTAIKIQSALKQYESGNTSAIRTASVGSSPSANSIRPASTISSSVISDYSGEIGVTRLPDYGAEELKRTPSSSGVQSATFVNPSELAPAAAGAAR